MIDQSDSLLGIFTQAGVLHAGDVFLAKRLGKICDETDPSVLLACALTARFLRAGSVCINPLTIAQAPLDLAETTTLHAELPWPNPANWIAALQASSMVTNDDQCVGSRPLRFVAGLLYFERYWLHQESCRQQISHRRQLLRTPEDPALVRQILDRLFPGIDLGAGEPDLQRVAAACAFSSGFTVIAGGPGTGKTTTIARTLALLLSQSSKKLAVCLAAPTGKAAARLSESVQDQIHQISTNFDQEIAQQLAAIPASTIHRLLGWRPDSRTRFNHDATKPLPYDVVVVDEVSMVSLALMARLLEALAPHATIILVGDPDQLASVEAGAVLADIVNADYPASQKLAAALQLLDADGLQLRSQSLSPQQFYSPIVQLQHTWRFGSTISALAAAIQNSDPDCTLQILASRSSEVDLVAVDTSMRLSADHPELSTLREMIIATGCAVHTSASLNDPTQALQLMNKHRLLCAHRHGPAGVQYWSGLAQGWLATAIPELTDDWYPGLGILITENLRDLDLYNGDYGVVVETISGLQAAFLRADQVRLFSRAQLDAAEAMYAMTVHKSQGSQFEVVSLILPPVGSPLLTRELLYTAVTRASQKVVIYGSKEAVETAVTTPAFRASGLQYRLSV